MSFAGNYTFWGDTTKTAVALIDYGFVSLMSATTIEAVMSTLVRNLSGKLARSPKRRKEEEKFLLDYLMCSIRDAKLIAAYFPEIELVYSTLLILFWGGTYDSCDRISWRVLPTFP